MEKGRNIIKGSELLKQFMSCLSSGDGCAEMEQGRAWLPGQDVEAQLVPAGESRGGMCWAPPASQEGRGMAKGTLGVKCPPPAFCTVCGFFMRFHPFELYLYNSQAGRIALGKN